MLPNDPMSSLPELPRLTPAQWGQLGGGAALALVGSGLVSLGTLVRLAAVVGGSALAYRAWREGEASPSASASALADEEGSVDSGRFDTGSSSQSMPSSVAGAETSREPVIDLTGG